MTFETTGHIKYSTSENLDDLLEDSLDILRVKKEEAISVESYYSVPANIRKQAQFIHFDMNAPDEIDSLMERIYYKQDVESRSLEIELTPDRYMDQIYTASMIVASEYWKEGKDRGKSEFRDKARDYVLRAEKYATTELRQRLARCVIAQLNVEEEKEMAQKS